MHNHDLSKFRKTAPIDQTFEEFIHQALLDLQSISSKLLKMADLFKLVQNYIKSLKLQLKAKMCRKSGRSTSIKCVIFYEFKNKTVEIAY